MINHKKGFINIIIEILNDKLRANGHFINII